MQFYTGIFLDNTLGTTECFFAKMDRQGTPQQMTFLNNENLQSEVSYCAALALTENQDMVVVGRVTSGTAGRTSALIMLLDDDLTLDPVIRIWSNSLAYSAAT